MNSASITRRVLLILDHGGSDRPDAFDGRADLDALDGLVHCTEKGWRSSWHERMSDEEHAYDERAFGIGEPLDFAQSA